MDTMQRRRTIRWLAACAAAAAAPLPARAQAFPSRPVRLVNPFAPGGSADVVGRSVAAALSQVLGQQVIVENAAGAGGTVGSGNVARAQADGYTLLLSNVASQAIAHSLYAKVPYDSSTDFEHVGLIGAMPNVFVVNPSFPAKNVAEFLEVGRSKSRNLLFGSAGNGSTPHLSAELLKSRTGIDAQHVPYKGAGPALIALMAGETSFQFENISTAVPQVKGGKLRALAVTGSSRSPALPDVPTMEEQGLPGFVVETWYGLSAPARTPAPVVQQLNRALVSVLSETGLVTKLGELGMQVKPGTPQAYRDFVVAETKKWGDIVKASGARVD